LDANDGQSQVAPVPAERVAASATGEDEAAESALVLDSASIPCRVEPRIDGWSIFVQDADLSSAQASLSAYRSENPPFVPEEPAPSLPGATPAAVAVAALLVAFHFLTGSGVSNDWVARGIADSARILSGEPWRAVTALTLHSNFPHVLGNAVATVIFVAAVGRWVGSGLGLWLVLLAGASGNWANALVHGSGHLSLGASTATFGAVGLAGALQFMHRRRFAPRAWVALGASLALLAMLGTGPRSDVLAHVMGLASGAMLGVLCAGILGRRTVGPAGQVAFQLASAACIAGSWALAWRA
jgi:membrane associated rhomboid family serine protease